ncbi:hypothetical protein H2198_003843 [Neophaeococcomyces mojaviensis]|uniref:Uncharacterized protein n=1 Tax=Neophaeococcomyces mojaviensis TaxID=3383035 RepID=A0ACC3AAC8_9EURO|nr:hypothetical protein H2198_003843 [Knufia sp. JES_112]
MLRRLPTALTISPEDVTAFEEALQRRVAYAHYQKTGEDPEGLFTGQAQQKNKSGEKGGKVVDPNDELKPLPGEQARIVRGREERIMGTGRTAGGSGR